MQKADAPDALGQSLYVAVIISPTLAQLNLRKLDGLKFDFALLDIFHFDHLSEFQSAIFSRRVQSTGAPAYRVIVDLLADSEKFSLPRRQGHTNLVLRADRIHIGWVRRSARRPVNPTVARARNGNVKPYSRMLLHMRSAVASLFCGFRA
jgi:hypothetical protein